MTRSAALPVPPEQRLQSLDVLRAFALLGILVVNMFDFAFTVDVETPPWERFPHWWDQAATGIMSALFAGKFNSLFSFLFGIGFYLQLERLSAQGAAAMPIYVRRLLLLLIIGALHAIFIWWGDVLHMYAVLGVVLLVLRKASNRMLWAAMAFCLVAGIAPVLYENATMDEADMAVRKAEDAPMIARLNRTSAGAGYREATRLRLETQLHAYSQARMVFPSYAVFLTTMLLGVWVARAGYFRRTREQRSFLKKAMIGCLAFGLACGVAMAIIGSYLRPYEISPLVAIFMVLYSAGRPPLMLAYAIAIVLLLDAGRLRRFFGWLSAMGRMPLTNYLMQSVISTVLFYRYGFGLVDRMPPAAALLLSFVIWALQIPLSVWWFRRFSFGPMEWVWRTATYGAAPSPRAAMSPAPGL